MSYLDVKNIVHAYETGAESHRALNDVSVSLGKSEFFTLLGPSGCGKTTLLRILAGFEIPQQGDVSLDGEPILATPPYERPVNTVFQNYALFPHLSVLRNVTFGLKMRGMPKSQRHQAAYDALELVQLQGFEDRRPSDLSGGQQQRVALARALACKPKLLLLDEPLSALDYKLRKEMQIELKQIQIKSQTTFVFVTHDQEEALTMSDRIAVMQNGVIEQIGTPREIYSSPKTKFVAGFIGESNFVGANLTALQQGAATVRLANGRQIEFPAKATKVGEQSLGKEVEIIVRPEFLRLATSDAFFAGSVRDRIFSGATSTTIIELEHDLGTVSLSHAGGDSADIGVGDMVQLSFDPKDATVLVA